MELLVRINVKSLIKIMRLGKECFKIILNSLIKNLKIIFHAIINREGISQY